MTKEELIGTWWCRKSVEGGVEKEYKKPKFSCTFEANGTGKFKILFIPMNFKWDLTDGVLKLTKPEDGSVWDSEVRLNGECIEMVADNSVSYFYKG